MKNILAGGTAVFIIPTAKVFSAETGHSTGKSALGNISESENEFRRIIEKYGSELGDIKSKK